MALIEYVRKREEDGFEMRSHFVWREKGLFERMIPYLATFCTFTFGEKAGVGVCDSRTLRGSIS